MIELFPTSEMKAFWPTVSVSTWVNTGLKGGHYVRNYV